MCFNTAIEINEIVPRSRIKDALFWKNRVPMCIFHHEAYHHDGLSDEKLASLTEMRSKFLTSIGRSQYI